MPKEIISVNLKNYPRSRSILFCRIIVFKDKVEKLHSSTFNFRWSIIFNVSTTS